MDNRVALPFQLNPSSGTPIYQQLLEQIHRRIAGGALHAGDKLPPARQLARQCAVSWVTVAKAYSLLEALGVLDCVRGKGMIVASDQGRPGSVRDITERKQMASELGESQAYNRRLFADSSIPLVVLDPAVGTFLDCNAAAVAIYGFHSRKDVLGKTPADVSTETQYDGTQSRIAVPERIKLALERGSHSFEWRHQRPDGEIWDAEVQLMRFEYRQREYLQFSLLDVTQRRRAQHRDLLLRKLNESLLLPGNLTDKMKRITDAVVDLLEPEFARIWLINPGDRCAAGCMHAQVAEGPHVCRNRQRCLHLTASSGRYTRLNGQLHARVPLGCYVIGSVATGKESCFVTNDIATDPRVHDRDWARSLGLSSFAGCRLQATDRSPAGVLALFSQRQITAEDKALIESLANTTSLVLQTAQAVETLRRSEDKFACAFRASPDALIITRVADGVIVDVNEGFCAMTSHPREELIGKTTLDIGLWTNPDDPSQFVHALETEGRLPETEYKFRTKSGQVLDCTLAAEAIYIGADRCALSIIRDVTRRKQAEMELLREKQFTEKLLESLPGIFFLYDSTCHLKRWNKAHETATGFTADELRDWHIPNWHETPEAAAKGMAMVKSVLETGVGGAFETTLINKQGSFVPYLISITRLMTPDGPAMMGVGLDITQRKQAEMDLLREKQFTEKLLESLPGIFFLYDSTCHLKRWNKAHETATGFTADELRDWYIPNWHETPEDSAKGMALAQSLLETGIGGAFETSLINKQGRFVPYLISVTRLMTPNGPAMMGVGLDITERKQIEEERKRLTAILDSTSDVVVMHYPEGALFYLNAAGRRVLGWAPTATLESHTFGELYPAWACNLLRDEAMPAVNRTGFWQGETAILGAGGREIPVSQLLMAHRAADGHIEHYSSIMRDITERKRAEQELRASLEEKTALLKEVHHRVKNNLQIVSSLLNLQAAQTRDSLALAVLQDTQNRVRSMALIHETLYRSGNLARIGFKAYVETLCIHLFRIFGVDTSRIRLVRDIADVALEMDEAVPCGLIINELVSNALKHAFPGGRPGQITVGLAAEPEGQRTLRVADDGVGLPSGLDVSRTASLGLHLVSSLADQLAGTLEVESGQGTVFRLTFPTTVKRDHP